MRTVQKVLATFILATYFPACLAEEDPLSTALGRYIGQLQATERQLREGACFQSEHGRQRAYLHMMRMVIKSVEEDVLQDPDFPYFRVIDFLARTGGDNPDQRYLMAPVRGGVAYRVWGNLGAAKRLEIQLYAGEPWAGEGRSAGYLAFEDIEFAEDGSFSVELTPSEIQKTSVLHNPADATTAMVRQIYDEWTDEYPGEVHIDRVGYEGEAKPQPTIEDIASRLSNAADNLYTSTTVWPEFVRERYVNKREANVLPGLSSTYQSGGVKGRWMTETYFSVPKGKALVIKTWPTRAVYQAIQLTDCYFASLEYANRITSLTSRQATQAPDGAIYYVVAQEDPGYANWLDTVGLSEGTVLLRYDGVRGDIPKEKWPSAKLVDLDGLASVIPGFDQQKVSPLDRKTGLSERRKHIQVRFNR